MNYVYRITTKKDAPKYWQGKTKTMTEESLRDLGREWVKRHG